MENVFLAINKEYFGMGLKSIDLLILAQVEEFKRNNCECYVTNKQFSDMFGESESTIKRSIDKLEEMQIIKRTTKTNNSGGKQSRMRTLTINDTGIKKLSKVQNEPKQGSNTDEARFKNELSKVQNEPIKDNLKDNIKDNLRDSEAKEQRTERKQEDNSSLTNKKKKSLEETLRGMSTEELTEIKRLYDARTPYTEIAEQYNIVYFDVELFKNIYDTVYQERYDAEHPEEAQRRREAEHERIQREMADFQFVNQIMKQQKANKRETRRALDDIFDEYNDDAI